MLGYIIIFLILSIIIYGFSTKEYWEDISNPDDKIDEEDLL